MSNIHLYHKTLGHNTLKKVHTIKPNLTKCTDNGEGRKSLWVSHKNMKVGILEPYGRDITAGNLVSASNN